MATLSIFSTFNWFRGLQIGTGLSLLVVFLGCQSKTNPPKQKPIYVDQTYYQVIKACADVYEAKYHIEVPIVACNEACILKLFIDDSSHLIIGSFEIDEDLKAIVKSQGYTLNTEPLAYSAIVGLSATQQSFNLTKNNTYFILNQEQNINKWIQQFSLENTFGLNNIDSLFTRLLVEKKAIGLVNLVSLNQYKNEFGWEGKDSLSILAIENDSEEVFPNSVDIAKGNYKYYMPICFLFKKESIGHEARFLKFLFQRDGQKILHKEGLVPLLNFERNIEISRE